MFTATLWQHKSLSPMNLTNERTTTTTTGEGEKIEESNFDSTRIRHKPN